MRHGMKALALIGIAAFLSGLSTAHATIVTTRWAVEVTSQYDYATGQYVPVSVPSSFELVISFPLLVTGVTDYGTTTITNFGALGETVFVSPLTAVVGADPFGNGLADQVAYTFPNVSDYPTVPFVSDQNFIEEFASQSNAYSPLGTQFWSYHIELRATTWSSSRSGIGLDD